MIVLAGTTNSLEIKVKHGLKKYLIGYPPTPLFSYQCFDLRTEKAITRNRHKHGAILNEFQIILVRMKCRPLQRRIHTHYYLHTNILGF